MVKSGQVIFERITFVIQIIVNPDEIKMLSNDI